MTSKLYSMVICPFAQRTRMHLALKNIDFELVNLDICKPRPDWFLALNPKGQVPVLEIEGQLICDSTQIGFYLAPEQQARYANLADFIDTAFIPALYRLMASRSPEAIEQQTAAALETWRGLNALLAALGYQGHYLEETMGLAETLIAPFFHRYQVVAYYQGFRLPETDDYKLARLWRDSLLLAPITNDTAEPIEDLIKMYEDYTLAHFNGSVPPGKRHSSLDLSQPMASRPMPAAFV